MKRPSAAAMFVFLQLPAVGPRGKLFDTSTLCSPCFHCHTQPFLHSHTLLSFYSHLLLCFIVFQVTVQAGFGHHEDPHSLGHERGRVGGGICSSAPTGDGHGLCFAVGAAHAVACYIKSLSFLCSKIQLAKAPIFPGIAICLIARHVL